MHNIGRYNFDFVTLFLSVKKKRKKERKKERKKKRLMGTQYGRIP